jgi:hypothetical protein
VTLGYPNGENVSDFERQSSLTKSVFFDSSFRRTAMQARIWFLDSIKKNISFGLSASLLIQ